MSKIMYKEATITISGLTASKTIHLKIYADNGTLFRKVAIITPQRKIGAVISRGEVNETFHTSEPGYLCMYVKGCQHNRPLFKTFDVT